jgi:hypothetical protein
VARTHDDRRAEISGVVRQLPARNETLELVRSAWDAGAYEDAATIGAHAADVGARRLGSLAARFGRALAKARGRTGVAAAPALEEALGIAEEIGRPAPPVDDVRRTLAALHVAAAGKAEAGGDLGGALFHCEQAAAVLPAHPETRNLRQRLAARAREIYLEGYSLEELDPATALRRFELAARLGGPGDPWAAKATARADRLRRDAPRGGSTNGV